MFDYARSDTHFLLYIYDNLRNELLEKSDSSIPDGDLVSVVLSRSKEVALQRYERPFYDAQRGMGPSGWFGLLSYSPTIFSRQQFAVFRAVHQWRDKVARKEDESVNIIMPKHVIYNLAREMPTEMPALLGCSHPISPPVRERAEELLDLIINAGSEGATGPDLKETMQAINNERPEAEKAFVSSAQIALEVPGKKLAPALVIDPKMPARSASSSFWGPTINRSPQIQAAQAQRPLEALRLALPLPRLTAEVFRAPDTGQSKVTKPGANDPGARAEHPYVRDRKPKEENVFIVKNLGGRGKRKASSLDERPEPISLNGGQAEAANFDQDEAEETGMSLDGAGEGQAAREKAEQKAERKARKKAEKQRLKLEERQRANGHISGQANLEEEPFDYENAPSVLHARKGANGVSGSEGVFDPYSKSLDAPKGMRRVRKERAGKSFTFKG